MNASRPPQIKTHHLQRRAIVYLRQSSLKQVADNQGSAAHQRAQADHARRWGWAEHHIEVIDADLGVSGTSGENRAGWQRLLHLIDQGQVGIVLVTDTSRLARSTIDFAILLRLCHTRDVLLAVNGGIVDPHESGSRFAAKVLADAAEYDNDQRAERIVRAKRARIDQGFAVSAPPTGYVKVAKGRWGKDPDLAVQHAIAEVFKQYDAWGSIGRVLRFFAAHGLKLPKRTPSGELQWLRPTTHRLHHILRNPAFAGFYAWGRRPPVPGGPPARPRIVDWELRLMVPDHHEGYITPAHFHRIDEQLRRNRVAHGPPTGAGPALCQGRVVCGRCGHTMLTQYARKRHGPCISYVCKQAKMAYGDPVCWSVNGNRLDVVVAAEVLKALAPPELEAIRAAAAEANAGFEAARQQREAEVKRAQYEADLAKRRYSQVDPAHRLVAASLEQEWERAEARVRAVERQQAEVPLVPPVVITPDTLPAIRAVAADLPALWAAPSTTHLDRKQIIRLLVREVRIVARSEAAFAAEIAWVGGAVTHHRIAGPYAGPLLIRQLAAEGRDAGEIVAELNRRGVTNMRGIPYTRQFVRAILRRPARRTSGGVPYPSRHRSGPASLPGTVATRRPAGRNHLDRR